MNPLRRRIRKSTSLRTRVAIAAALSAAVVIALFAVGTSLVLARNDTVQLDRRLDAIIDSSVYAGSIRDPRRGPLITARSPTTGQVVSVDDVLALVGGHRCARGVRRLPDVLSLVDRGAASPKETWLRLLLIDAGFPRPLTQIPVHRGWQLVGMLDMGWPRYMVAAEYDGEQHRTDRRQYVKDLRRLRTLEQLGWIVIRVIAEDRPAAIIARVDEAMGRSGFHRDLR